MAFTFVRSAGDVTEPAIVSIAVSGQVSIGDLALFTSGGTGGAMADAAVALASPGTAFIGVYQERKLGASDTFAKMIKINSEQLWEADCANTVTTAQIGVRQYVSATRGFLHNQASDIEDVQRCFMPIAVIGSTSGSGKLLGYFSTYQGNVFSGV